MSGYKCNEITQFEMIPKSLNYGTQTSYTFILQNADGITMDPNSSLNINLPTGIDIIEQK